MKEVYDIYKKIHKKKIITESDLENLKNKDIVILLNILGKDIQDLSNRIVAMNNTL